jgi:hypothetical protein
VILITPYTTLHYGNLATSLELLAAAEILLFKFKQ